MPFRIREDSASRSPRLGRIAFDNIEVDLCSGEVRKNRTRIRVQPQPFQLLVLLLENAGDVVSREEICRELWATDTFVDFEHGLAAAVNKIRDALGDAADNPRYIETLPKRGYRFIGSIKPDPPMAMPAAEPPPSVELVPVAAAKPDTGWKWILGALAAIALLAVAVAFLRLRGNPGDSLPMTVVPFTSYPGLETAPSFSPDGSRIAFSWDGGTGHRTGRPQYDLYVKAIGSETLLRLTSHPSDWISSTWSPDGTQIAFHRLATDDNGLYVVPALGGPERKLIATHTPYDLAAPLSWSPDGKWLAYADTENGRPGDRAFLLNMETLESHEFPHDPSCLHEGYLTFSHSGQQLAVLCVHNTIDFEYLVTDLEGKSKRSLATFHDFPSGLVWTGDDRSLVFAPYFLGGEEFYEVQVSDGRARKISVTSGSWPAISRDGHKLAVSVSDIHVNIWRRDLQHPEAAAVPMYSSSRPQEDSQYSPDGKYVAFNSDRSGTWSVWMARVDGSDPVQISREGPAGYPRWSPDSQKITFEMVDSGGLIGIYTADIAGRLPHKLKTNIREVSRPSWSHDGTWIYFLGYGETGHQLYRCRAEGGDATLLTASGDPMTAMESSDGKVLYFTWWTGNTNIMTLPLDCPGAPPRAVPGLPKVFDEGQWTPAANGIYFTPHDKPRSICFFDFATRQTRQIFKADKDLADGMSISPDGRYMLYSQIDESNADIMLVNNFR